MSYLDILFSVIHHKYQTTALEIFAVKVHKETGRKLPFFCDKISYTIAFIAFLSDAIHVLILGFHITVKVPLQM